MQHCLRHSRPVRLPAPRWMYTMSSRSTTRTLCANCPTCSRRLTSATCRRSCIAPSMAIRCVTSFSGLMKPDVLRKASGGDDVENQLGKCVRIEGRSTASFRKSPWRLEQLTYAGGVKRTGKIIPLAELAVQSTQMVELGD